MNLKELKEYIGAGSTYNIPEEILKGYDDYENIKDDVYAYFNSYETLKEISLRYVGKIIDYRKIPDELRKKGIKKSNWKVYSPEDARLIGEWMIEHCSKGKSLNYKETMLKKYGVENGFQLESVKEKSKLTMIEKYGVDNFQKTEKGRERARKLGSNEEIIDKRCKTNIERYGSTCPMQSEINKKAIKEYFLEKYGKETYLGSQDCIAKSEKTVLEKFGVKNVSQSDEIKQKKVETCLRHYGVEHPLHSEEIKKKLEETCMKKYGTYSYLGSKECRENLKNINCSYDGKTFDSWWELAFYYHLKKAGVKFEFHPDITLKYKYDGKEHSYFPDFEVDGKLIEIKGDQFFDKDGNFINPYNPSMNGIMEAKYRCMIENNVKILRKKDLKEILKEAEEIEAI